MTDLYDGNPVQYIDAREFYNLVGREQVVPLTIMKQLIPLAKYYYSCNRPPGAAGAIIDAFEGFVFAGVQPVYGAPTCKDVGCDIVDGHCIRTIHAEQRAIFFAARIGIQLSNTTIYSVLKPCYRCTQAIIAAGIKHIYYAGAAYDEDRTRKILEIADVTCEKLDVGLEYGQ